jgi:two-component system, OmpR family, KDP operon response regulator KdpE
VGGTDAGENNGTGPPGRARVRLLLVEDNELNRALVRAILHRAAEPGLRDAELIEACSLSQARAVLASAPVDIVLLDVQLPDGSGLSLMDELAPDGPRPAVIAVTGGVLPEQRAAAITAGCSAIIDKPFVAADLVAALTAYLPDRRRN